MGFRTILVLNNDRASDWAKDQNLGRKIEIDMNNPMKSRKDSMTNELGGCGHVARCEHADNTYLAVVENFEVTPVYDMGDKEKALQMLKDAAMALGYSVVKRRSR